MFQSANLYTHNVKGRTRDVTFHSNKYIEDDEERLNRASFWKQFNRKLWGRGNNTHKNQSLSGLEPRTFRSRVHSTDHWATEADLFWLIFRYIRLNLFLKSKQNIGKILWIRHFIHGQTIFIHKFWKKMFFLTVYRKMLPSRQNTFTNNI